MFCNTIRWKADIAQTSLNGCSSYPFWTWWSAIALDTSPRLDNHEWEGVEAAIINLRGWLQSLGLEQYETVFRENEIDETRKSRWQSIRLTGSFSSLAAVTHHEKIVEAAKNTINKPIHLVLAALTYCQPKDDQIKTA